MAAGIGFTDDAETQQEDASKEENDKQKKADDYFNSLLSKGRGKKRKFDDDAAPAAPGFVAAKATSDEKKPPKIFKKDPNLGKWEKHTKGFGLKMLAKMGYTGSGGLGSKRRARKPVPTEEKSEVQPSVDKPDSDGEAEIKKGISRPVEVVVRPANLGLGFGNFKEATQLKSNKIIEAEVRGIKVSENAKNDGERIPSDSFSRRSSSSALPSTKQLMQQKQWKRGKSLNSKKSAPTVLPYADLLKKQEEESKDATYHVIDMRGPEKDEKAEDGSVPLAEELLHNVSFLLNTYENKIHSTAHFVRTGEQSIKSLIADIDDMELRQRKGEERIKALEEVALALDEASEISQSIDPNMSLADSIEGAMKLANNLAGRLGEADTKLLQFWDVVAPYLLSSTIQYHIDRWDPLGDLSTSCKVVNVITQLGDTTSTSPKVEAAALISLRKAIISNHLLPKVASSINSLKWDPCLDDGIAIDFVNHLMTEISKGISIVTNSVTTRPTIDGGVFDQAADEDKDDDKAASKNFSMEVKEELVDNIIYPKLLNRLKHWKPEVEEDENGQLRLKDSLHFWILPWLSHVDHPALLPELMRECKQKLKSGLKTLLLRIKDDRNALNACLRVVSPWVMILGSKFMHSVGAETIVPRLSRVLYKQQLEWNPDRQDFSAIELMYSYHEASALSDTEFISMMEGEVVSKWALVLYEKLVDDKNVDEAKESYRGWKRRIFAENRRGKQITSNADRAPHGLLREDAYICRIFLSVLRLIQLFQEKSSDQEVVDLAPPANSFQTARSRRMKNLRRKEKEDLMKLSGVGDEESRIRSKASSLSVPFREIIEEFAQDHGVLFQPRLGTSSKSIKDGKQVYLFGSVPSYIDGDVAYALDSNEWQPVSLEGLLALSKGKSAADA